MRSTSASCRCVKVDLARMYAIRAELVPLDASGVYLDEEVERFCTVYFKPKQRQSALDHQAMNAALDPSRPAELLTFRTPY